LTDSVAVDAKRILLRYGAPIAILDKVSEPHRIEFAREIARTMLPERQPRLRQLLAEHGYADPEAVKNAKGKSRRARPKQNAAGSTGSRPKAGKARGPQVTKTARATKDEVAKAGRPKAKPKAKPKARKK
jgi:hypothetical protein